MADFYQNGIITTLHNLSDRPLADLEQELVKFSKQRPMSLILPSLYSELEGEALPKIIQHLKDVPYLSQIETGKRKGTTEVLAALAPALDLSLDDLIATELA